MTQPGRSWLRKYDSDAIAGVAAAMAALVLHLFHVIETDTLLYLRTSSEAFAQGARGEMVWSNVCLMMFKPQDLCDCLLRPAIENPDVTRVTFVLDEGERANWQLHVAPTLAACAGHSKVLEPRWSARHESVPFILADRAADGQPEAQLCF